MFPPQAVRRTLTESSSYVSSWLPHFLQLSIGMGISPVDDVYQS